MRILIVEDDRSIAAAIRKGLTASGYAVDVAGDGERGLWFATESAYDVIILDLMLPKLNGFEFCKAVRDKEIWSSILVLTARNGEFDEANALDLGADDYLVKPFSLVVLTAHIRALVRRGNQPRPVRIFAGSLVIDPASRKCFVDSAEVELTTKEFAVIEYLARKPDTVVSKSEIMEDVWDYNYDGDPNIVEVYIRRLRRKLGLPRAGTDIVTIRGAGYRLSSPVEGGNSHSIAK